MIARAKKIKIFKGETPYEELQQAFRDEMKDILKDAALRLHCDVERLKCRFDNNGVVEVIMMTETEMAEREKNRLLTKKVNQIKSSKGMN